MAAVHPSLPPPPPFHTGREIARECDEVTCALNYSNIINETETEMAINSNKNTTQTLNALFFYLETQ